MYVCASPRAIPITTSWFIHQGGEENHKKKERERELSNSRAHINSRDSWHYFFHRIRGIFGFSRRKEGKKKEWRPKLCCSLLITLSSGWGFFLGVVIFYPSATSFFFPKRKERKEIKKRNVSLSLSQVRARMYAFVKRERERKEATKNSSITNMHMIPIDTF